MTRRSRAALLATAVAVALGATTVAEAATYRGTVGPGRVITLTNSRGASVTRVPAARHTFVVQDLSDTHNWVLARSSTIIRRTPVDARGRYTFRRVRLTRGNYVVYCATHRRTMRRTFRAV